MATGAMAIETCCPPVVTCPEVKVECTFPNPPVINCPEVNVKCECPITTECPAINAICEVGAIGLPGLWRLSIGGRTSCGTIEVVGSGFLLTDAREGKADYFLINVLKKARQVESCE